MERKILSIEQINALIAAEMEKHEECAGKKVYSVYAHKPDAEGCNWDINTGSGAPEDPGICRDRVLEAARSLRAQYNVPDPTQAPTDF
jgi:hypothetical protein